MSAELVRIVAFIRTFHERVAERRVRSRYGTALFVDSLPCVHWLNVLSVDPGVRASAENLATDADDVQAALRHRKVVTDRELGQEVEDGFRGLGWRVERLVLMVHRGAVPSGVRADEVGPDDLEPVWAEGIREEPFGKDEEVVRQLVAAQHRRRQAARVRYFGVRAESRIASYCELFSDGRTAQVESVMTLERFRGRGLATAVVTTAVGAARDAGHDLVFLLADDDDWPKELYRKLGFEPVGYRWDFLRAPVAGSTR